MGIVDLGVDEYCPTRKRLGWLSLARLGRVTFSVVVIAFFAIWGPIADTHAAPPRIDDTWATSVTTSTARIYAEINPRGLTTTYHFEFISDTDYQNNLSESKDGFSGAAKTAGTAPSIPAGPTSVSVFRLISGLKLGSTYHYRAVAENSEAVILGPKRILTTYSTVGGQQFASNRSWEMVSPIDKNGGSIEGFGANAGGGVLQASADGNAITYSTSTSFGQGAQGAALASQYLSRRGSNGWSTLNITIPSLSGGYGNEPLGVPYQLFSPDLSSGLVLNGRHCRGSGQACGVPSLPPPGLDAPSGYQNYYLWEEDDGLKAVLTQSSMAILSLAPEQFTFNFSGAAPDMRHVVFSTCAAITADAIEIPDGADGCDAASPNLYKWSGSALQLVNVLPGQVQGSPGASLAAQSGAVSHDGSRIYWVDLVGGNLFLRDGGTTRQVDAGAGGGGAFQTASVDGSVAFFTKNGHLYRYEVAGEEITDLTPGGEVEGVLGASEDGSHVYYLTASGLFLRKGDNAVKVADAADSSNYPPSTGTARVSADGNNLVFLSSSSLTGRDNIDIDTGEPVSEVFHYDAQAGTLTCASCNLTNQRPLGASVIMGAIPNGSLPGVTQSYKPRVFSADGKRIFFESHDALVLKDTNSEIDVYQWEADGAGDCQISEGCVGLISSGRSPEGATLIDASIDGSDVFFLTDGSLLESDLGAVDIYDARLNGGFPVPPAPIRCKGDACQSLPPEPEDPSLGTLVPGHANLAVRFPRTKRRHGKRAEVKKPARGKKRSRHRSRRHRGRNR